MLISDVKLGTWVLIFDGPYWWSHTMDLPEYGMCADAFYERGSTELTVKVFEANGSNHVNPANPLYILANVVRLGRKLAFEDIGDILHLKAVATSALRTLLWRFLKGQASEAVEERDEDE